MIVSLLLMTEPNRGNIGRTKEALNSIGLVPARTDYLNPFSKSYDDVMVWEDPEEHIGRYRVHLYEDVELDGETGLCDSISFRYWINKRSLKKEIIEQDPMALAIQKVLPLLEGKVEIRTEKEFTRIAPLEEVLRDCFPD